MINSKKEYKEDMGEFLLLGIPLQNLSLQENAEGILNLIEQAKVKQETYYIGTLNIHCICQALTPFSLTPYHPELLSILRHASQLTPRGVSIATITELLGASLQEKIKCGDFYELLLKLLSERGLSLFFLVGDGEKFENSVKKLQVRYPTLRINGFAHPPVSTSGKELVSTPFQDEQLLHQIHQAKADLIILALGCTKQELWFERIQKNIRGSVVLCVEELQPFFEGSLPSPSLWKRMQKIGWMAACKDAFRFLAITLPLLSLHTWHKTLCLLFPPSEIKRTAHSKLFLSPEKSLAVVTLPSSLTQENCSQVLRIVEEAFAQGTVVVDFRPFYDFDLHGLALLLRLWQLAEERSVTLLAFDISKSMRRLLRFHRLWDILEDFHFCHSHALVSSILKNNPSPFLEAVEQNHGNLTLSLFGSLDHRKDYVLYLEKMSNMLWNKNCCVDLSFCTYIDNAGFTFLARLIEAVENQGHQIVFRNVSTELQKLFHLAQLTIKVNKESL